MIFPTERIIYKVGNHDFRLDNYVMTRAGELWGLDAIKLNELLKLNDMDIHFVDSSRPIHVGELMIAHGHEWGGGGGGINAARGMFLKANCNLLIGHFHRSQEFIFRNGLNKTNGVWVQGCLCSLSPQYLPFNNWNHGFSVVEMSASGAFVVHNKKIIDGIVC